MLDVIVDSQMIADRIGAAVARTVESLTRDDVTQEPQFTDRLLARIEDAVNGSELTRAQWHAATLGDRGPGSAESRIGADFLGVFEVTTEALTISKGFFAQAKMLEVGDCLSKSEHNRLRQQCQLMLRRTPDSFVFLYGMSGVRVVSAHSVSGAASRELDELGTKTVTEFFHDHFRCFIGDNSLTGPEVLRADWSPPPRPFSSNPYFPLRLRTGLNRLLYIQAVDR